MKSIKEKAKAYDELKVKAQELEEDGCFDKLTLFDLFPELAESEDERIRKALIHLVNSNKELSFGIDNYDGIKWSDILAWLEKQGSVHLAWSEEDNNMLKWVIEYLKNRMLNAPISEERTACKNAIAWLEKLKDEKKPADEIEQKFKVGDWIVGANSVLKIISLNDELNCYIAVTPNNEEVKIPYYFDDGKGHMCSYHLWTIQDANDGDALSDGTTIFIFKDLLSDGSVMSYCDYDTDSGESDAFCPLSMNLMCSKITPATKEQRDLLFPKMKEAGYEWDADKKELKKIVVPIFNIGDTIAKKHNSDIHDFGSFTITDIIGGKYWYNDRIICDITEQDRWEIYKSVKQKPSWSEEDEKKLLCICAWIKDYPRIADFKDEMYTVANNYINWLKSIKDRYTWKPSDEQMKALESALYTNMSRNDERYSVLSEFVAELKKLKKE